MIQELPIPGSAISDKNAIELIRVWVAGGQQHIALATDVWEDPEAWGLMLVDLAKHIARAYAQSEEYEFEKTLGLIKSGMDMEWSSPTD